MKRINYIVLIIGIVIILLGFFLMSGEGTTDTNFCPDIFNDVRTKVAPAICLLGYLLCGVWIMCSGAPMNRDK